ncbi:MAG: hypothetical protein JJU11_12020 [Candidatus Sumerlaeia bacterium]|nr:hypothetical protein [Candidatus Sumerlaeia bacterium]
MIAKLPVMMALALLLNLGGSGYSMVAEECELCPVEMAGEEGTVEIEAGKYAVVAPVGRQVVTMIEQAPRLESLEGKTVAVVGGSFMARVTHPEIRRLILTNYPTAKVILLNEIGSAGAYPGPGISRRSKDDFQRNLREMGVDAVISGNGGCGLCTPKEAGSSIAAEYIAIPAVTIAGPGFVDQVHSTGVNNGIPVPRTATYPGPFAAHSREELLRNTREVLWPQIVDALTRPITEEEIAEHRKAVVDDVRGVVYTGNLNEVNRHFAEMRWSDGLPIIPPTQQRIEEFLRYTDLAWDDSVGVLPIAHRETLAWHVAANGVMAGCPPEFMPLLVAYTKVLADPSHRRSLGSTHGWIPYAWVNGPVARQLGFDAQSGMVSGPRNAALGRYINLAVMNLAGYYVKQDRMGSFGYPMSWTMAEDEEACLRIGWMPFHVQRGHDLNDSTVTGATALMWGNNLTPATPDAEDVKNLFAWDVVEKSQFGVGSGMPFTYRTIMITEHIAQDLARVYTSKESLENALMDTARRPVYERAFANYWASPGSAHDPSRHSFEQHYQRIMRQESGALTEAPPWFPNLPGAEKIHTVPVMRRGMTPILIAGDPDRNKVQTMPGGGNVTIRIDLPDNWDELMEELGYRPLESFYLEAETHGGTLRR